MRIIIAFAKLLLLFVDDRHFIYLTFGKIIFAEYQINEDAEHRKYDKRKYPSGFISRIAVIIYYMQSAKRGNNNGNCTILNVIIIQINNKQNE